MKNSGGTLFIESRECIEMKTLILPCCVIFALTRTCGDNKHVDVAEPSQYMKEITSLEVFLDLEYENGDSVEAQVDSGGSVVKIPKPPQVLNRNDHVMVTLEIKNISDDSLRLNIHTSTFGLITHDSIGTFVAQYEVETDLRSSNWLAPFVILSPGGHTTVFKVSVPLRRIVDASESKYFRVRGFYWNRVRSINDLELVVGWVNSKPKRIKVN